MIGGFGGAGASVELIHALLVRFDASGRPKHLTPVNNNDGNGHVGLAALIEHAAVIRARFSRKYHALRSKLVPQGTLAERIPAGRRIRGPNVFVGVLAQGGFCPD
ncbi:hypothetical protein AB8Z38_30780 [Bradyrhizobium sp. LLZ17]|uniref:Uncharacterized protein n=1 Tax=Bradyrhizobium sp. LLZ17 TaxID=3239388 RepID=A0AB39XG07_9BRAD